MAPTTRAVAKRASDEIPSASKPVPKRKRQNKKIAKAESSPPPEKRDEQPFRFLDLSAELRNRVYEYAVEECNTRKYAPVLYKAPFKSYETRLWKYFALTQVCKQIRTEYRPLWMRDAAVRLGSIYAATQFFTDVLATEADFKHAPRLLQIAWDHGDNYLGMPWEITYLLRLHAFCPSFRCHFVPSKVAMGESPEDDLCLFCIEEMELEDHDMDLDRNMYDACTCPPMDLDMEEWVDYYIEQMEYMNTVSNLLHSTNEAWITDLRENKVSVYVAIAPDTDQITFRIVYKERLSTSASDYHIPARELLRKWGGFDLSCGPDVNWIVVYEESHEHTEDGLKMKTSVMHEAHFTMTTN